jgi:dipeptidyl aminopeptidase/acylaminoacyl peptidase
VATTARYGRWASPFAAADVARAKVSLSELCSDTEALYWLESRPAEAGRVVLVRAGDGALTDHSPPDVSIRSRVNEYGGGALSLVPGHATGAFAYVDHADQRVWFCDGPGGVSDAGVPVARPRPLTAAPPEGVVHNHGGLSVTADGDWVLAVREVHRPGVLRPRRSIVALGTRADPAPECVVLEGHDFFGTPRVDPTGERMAVVAWDHPDMPWDASQLLVVPLARHGEPTSSTASLGAAGEPRVVAGGLDESVGQPGWGRDGRLRFVSDRAGWWQPYREANPGPERLADVAAEFHGPDWVLGQSTLAELPDGTLAARMTASGRDALVIIDPAVAVAAAVGEASGPGGPNAPRVLLQPCVSLAAVCEHQGGLALIGTTPDAPSTVWIWRDEVGTHPVRPSAQTALRPADVAVGEPFALTGRTGRPVYGTLYRPALSGTGGPSDGAPPLVVWCHGGPTAACPAGLDLTVQFLTTRGFAVACVDYAGSSGYGRAYRCALWGQWGVADSEDCLDAARHRAARGDADPRRLAVRGASAGGMTALNALAAGEGFGACVSWYGVTDLMGLVAGTHDFEAHYTDRLIGPLPGTERLYEERSPRNRAHAMRGAVLLLQGTEDAVVPPSQAEGMRASLDAAAVRCDLRFFEGEGHGFRRADTLTACLEAELAFYVAHLELAEP